MLWMRYMKYSKISIFGLFSLALSFTQCSKEKGFQPYPCIKGQITDAITKKPIDSAIVMLWIDGLGSDTITYLTDSEGIYTTDRINNSFDKSLTIEASKQVSLNPGPLDYVPERIGVSPEILRTKMSFESDTLYINFELRLLYDSWHSVIPKRLDFLEGQYTSYFIIINEGFTQLYWELGENNTEWLSVYWWEVYNSASDINHLKRGGFVKFKVTIKSGLLTPGTYDSTILLITDQGNNIIPVHVTIG